jgi:hypothetical protein
MEALGMLVMVLERARGIFSSDGQITGRWQRLYYVSLGRGRTGIQMMYLKSAFTNSKPIVKISDK